LIPSARYRHDHFGFWQPCCAAVNRFIEINKLKKELYEILAQHSGQDYTKIEADSDRDYWMRAQEAKEYGMIDEVLQRK
jgi:ATP-dependent protease ClpP protease subunit